MEKKKIGQEKSVVWIEGSLLVPLMTKKYHISIGVGALHQKRPRTIALHQNMI